ncbi:MAG: terminase small subunit [Rhodobacteraceae bacterium]|nr:terminase small subunit [Paracoccaceae bacterium]|tara:strand:+ start:824 stop:1378 length:555 start_codon:yes stop_codon:yes gene_type:complete
MSDRDEAGRFAPGNRFWEARSSHGPKPKFDNSDDLWSACVEYFEWNEDNPLMETKGFAFQGVVTKETFPKMRAMTIGGLCLFLDVTHKQWIEWREKRPDLSAVITRAEAVIFKQKFEGASADLLNGNIIARELGLADKQDHQSSDGTMTPAPAVVLSKLSDEELAQLERLTDKARDSEGVGEAE